MFEHSDHYVGLSQKFIIKHLGKEYLNPPSSDLEASYAESDSTTPLIHILSRGSDPIDSILKFAQSLGFDEDKVQIVSLGQGQEEMANQKIFTAANEGLWVILQNCHLSPKWMHYLEDIFEEVSRCFPVLTFYLLCLPAADTTLGL